MAKELYTTLIGQMNNDGKMEYKCEVCGTSIDLSKTNIFSQGNEKGIDNEK